MDYLDWSLIICTTGFVIAAAFAAYFLWTAAGAGNEEE